MRRIPILYIVITSLKQYHITLFHRALNSKKREGLYTGFSLLELMLVICILAIAGAFAASNLADWRSNMRLKSTAGELKESLELAKLLAAKENTYIFVEFLPTEGKYRLKYISLDGNINLLREERLPPDVKIDKNHPKHTVTNDKTGFNARGGADNCTIVLTNLQNKSRFISISVLGKIEIKK